jgi:hypothetical protein
MTGDRSQIRTERHGQAPALTTAALPQPRPSALPCPETRDDAKPHSPACRATPTLSRPSPTAAPSPIAAPSSPVDPILLACHQASPTVSRQTPQAT